MKELRFLPEVFNDLTTAAGWYAEMGGVDLAGRFIETFYSILPALVRNADSHRKVLGEFRRTVLRPFPYKVYFRVVDETVVISLVIHCARDPRFVEEALKRRRSDQKE